MKVIVFANRPPTFFKKKRKTLQSDRLRVLELKWVNGKIKPFINIIPKTAQECQQMYGDWHDDKVNFQ